MRKVTMTIAKAFEANKSITSGNTRVEATREETAVYLHGNKIIWKTKGKTFFNLCGWNTPTTRECLQAANIRVTQRNFEAVTLQDIQKDDGSIIPSGSIISDTGVYSLVD